MKLRIKLHNRTQEDNLIGLPDVQYYEVIVEGHIEGLLPESQLSSYLKSRS